MQTENERADIVLLNEWCMYAGFFLGQKRSSVVADDHSYTHSKKYPPHMICEPNTDHY